MSCVVPCLEPVRSGETRILYLIALISRGATAENLLIIPTEQIDSNRHEPDSASCRTRLCIA